MKKIFIISSMIFLVMCSAPQHKKHKKANKTTAPSAKTEAAAGEFPSVAGITAEHNRLRAQENAGLPDLKWDAKVAAYSKSKMEYLAKNGCTLDHGAGPNNPGYGENLFMGGGTSWTGADAVNGWYEEKSDYSLSDNSCGGGKVCGHYTQVVWKNSTGLGCYRAVCPNDEGVIIGCNYNPPGNYVGEKPY